MQPPVISEVPSEGTGLGEPRTSVGSLMKWACVSLPSFPGRSLQLGRREEQATQQVTRRPSPGDGAKLRLQVAARPGIEPGLL